MDIFNQARQFDLALEKKWVTQNPYFRLYTTEVGSTLVDSWKIFKAKHKFGGFISTITQFGDITAKEMLDAANAIDDTGGISSTSNQVPEGSSTNVSTISSVSFEDRQRAHTHVFYPGSKQVRCIWCSRVNLVARKVTMKCKQCNFGFCRPTSGRECWSHHVAMGCVPQAPEKGTKRQRACDSDDV